MHNDELLPNASEGTLNMRMRCTDFEEEQQSMYGAQLKLRPGKKIELVIVIKLKPRASTEKLGSWRAAGQRGET